MAQGGLTYKFQDCRYPKSKIIIINIVLFVGIFVGAALFQKPMDLVHWFVLILQPLHYSAWSIVTYGFYMLVLAHPFQYVVAFCFGKYVLNLFSEKRFLTLYFLWNHFVEGYLHDFLQCISSFYGINGNLWEHPHR